MRGNTSRQQEHLQANQLQFHEGEREREHFKATRYNQLQSCEREHSKATGTLTGLSAPISRGRMWERAFLGHSKVNQLQSRERECERERQSAPDSWEGQSHSKSRITSKLISFRLVKGNVKGNIPRPLGSISSSLAVLWEGTLQGNRNTCRPISSNLEWEEEWEREHSKATPRPISSSLVRGNVRGNTPRSLGQSAPDPWEGQSHSKNRITSKPISSRLMKGNMKGNTPRPLGSISSSLMRGNTPREQEHLQAYQLQSRVRGGMWERAFQGHSKANQLQSHERVHSKVTRSISSRLVRGTVTLQEQDHLQADQLQAHERKCEREHSKATRFNQLQSREREHSKVTRSISSRLVRGNTPRSLGQSAPDS